MAIKRNQTQLLILVAIIQIVLLIYKADPFGKQPT